MIIERTFYVPNGDIVFHNGVVYEIKELRKFENGIFSYSAFEINHQDLEERMEKLGKKLVKKLGSEHQLSKIIEEITEVQRSIILRDNSDDLGDLKDGTLTEEVADLTIMSKQLPEIIKELINKYNLDREKIATIIARKLSKLEYIV